MKNNMRIIAIFVCVALLGMISIYCSPHYYEKLELTSPQENVAVIEGFKTRDLEAAQKKTSFTIVVPGYLPRLSIPNRIFTAQDALRLLIWSLTYNTC